MRSKLIALMSILAVCLSVDGCKPTEHPRRDRKARDAAQQNAQTADGLQDSVDGLGDAQSDLEARLLAALEACKEELRAEHAADIASLNSEVLVLTESLETVTEKCNESAAKCEGLETLLAGLTRDGDTLILTGVNLQIRDAADGARAPGLGNLLVGRDEPETFRDFYGRDPGRTGSNNLLVGGSNEYLSNGGLVVGKLNRLNGDCSVIFGCENEVLAELSSILGGKRGLSQAPNAVVVGGEGLVATTPFAVVPSILTPHDHDNGNNDDGGSGNNDDD